MAGRNHEIKIRVSKQELESIKQKADRVGLPISTYIRIVILSANPTKIPNSL